MIDTRQQTAVESEKWLDLPAIATVEVSSEADGYPIENALRPESHSGWRAGQPGTQTIRLIFDEPQDLRCIRLAFVESETPRTHEFVLRWSADRGMNLRDIIRQQWNFSPTAPREEENYQVNLRAATVLELTMVPDISGAKAHASVLALRVA